jgi:hypothetical protein
MNFNRHFHCQVAAQAEREGIQRWVSEVVRRSREIGWGGGIALGGFLSLGGARGLLAERAETHAALQGISSQTHADSQ